MSDMTHDPFSQCVVALEYMATAVHAGDLSALQYAALMWSEFSNHILKGELSWADLRLPLVRFGGSSVHAGQRVRPVTGGPLSPPSPGDPYLPYDRVDDIEGAKDIVLAAVEASLAAAGIEVVDVRRT